jgi:hypothetical protein
MDGRFFLVSIYLAGSGIGNTLLSGSLILGLSLLQKGLGDENMLKGRGGAAIYKKINKQMGLIRKKRLVSSDCRKTCARVFSHSSQLALPEGSKSEKSCSEYTAGVDTRILIAS